MPLVRIALLKGKSSSYIKAIADGVHEALVTAIKIPADDRFQLINEFEESHFIINKTYLGIQRSSDAVIIHITLKQGRTVEMKKDLYQQIITNLMANPGMRKEDIMIVLVENADAN